MSWKCNGYMDCIYGEDEADCFENNQLPVPNLIWELNDSNFDETLRWSGENVLVDFYAPWCKACVKFMPKFEQAAQEAQQYGFDVVFAKVNIGKSPVLKKRLGIETYPRILLFPRSGSRPRRYSKA